MRECLHDEVLNMRHSAAAYEAAKARLECKYDGTRKALTLRLDELDAFKPIRERNEKALEVFSELLNAIVVNLTDTGQEAELGNGSLYITLQRKFNRNLLTKYKQWITNSRPLTYTNQPDWKTSNTQPLLAWASGSIDSVAFNPRRGWGYIIT